MSDDEYRRMHFALRGDHDLLPANEAFLELSQYPRDVLAEFAAAFIRTNPRPEVSIMPDPETIQKMDKALLTVQTLLKTLSEDDKVEFFKSLVMDNRDAMYTALDQS